MALGMKFVLFALVFGNAHVLVESMCKIVSAMGGAAEIQLPDYEDGTECCKAFSTGVMYTVARTKGLPMPWTTIAGMIGLTAGCPAYVKDYGACTDAADHVGTADDAAAGKAMRYVCSNHDTCHAGSLKATGAVAAMGPMLQAALNKEAICKVADTHAPAKKAAPTTAAPTTAAPTKAAPTTAAPTTAKPAGGTTAAPTTAKPAGGTTAAPTTAKPAGGTTAAPTTAAPAGGTGTTKASTEASGAQSVTAKLWLALVPAAFAIASLVA